MLKPTLIVFIKKLLPGKVSGRSLLSITLTPASDYSLEQESLTLKGQFKGELHHPEIKNSCQIKFWQEFLDAVCR
jgi:hypothetical protein